MNQQQARNMLAEIEQTRQRSERFLGYWRRGAIVQMWGMVWMVAHLGGWFAPAKPAPGCCAVAATARRSTAA